MPIGSSQGITLPTQGGNTDTWGTDLNTELQKLINSVEAQVPNTAIDWSSTVDLNGQGVEDIDYFKFQTDNSTGNGVRSLYSSGGELYYIDGTGTTVQMTSNGTLNFGSVGGIGDSGGTYGTSGIEVDWNGTQYDFHDGAANYAPVRLDSVAFESSTFFITLDAPVLAASYSLTLPAAVPASATTPLVMSTSGAVTLATELDVTGDVYSGEVEHHIGLSAGADDGNFTFNNNGTAAPSWSFNSGGTGQYITFDNLPLRTTDRIKQVDVEFSNISGTSQDVVVTLFAGATSIGTDTTSSGGGATQTGSITGLTRRVLTGDDHFWIRIQHTSTGAMTFNIDKIKLTLDRTRP